MPYSNTWTTSYPQRRNSSYSPEVKSSLDVINRYIKGERLVEEVDPTSAWSVRSGIDKNRAMSVQQDRLLTSGISEQLNNIPSLGKGNNPANGNWTARKLDMPSPSLSNPNVVDPNASFRSLSPPRTGISGQPYPLINNERMRQHEDLFYHQRAVVEQSSSVQPVQTSQIDNKYHLTLVDVVDFLRWHYSSDPAAEESQLSVGNGISTLSEEDISSLTACLTEELIQMKRSSLVDASQPKLQQQASSFIPTPGLTAASSYISDDEFNKSAIITRTDTVQRTVERLPDRKQSSSSIGVQATPPVIPVVKNPQTVPELRKLYEADGVSDEGGNKQNKELVAASGIDPAVVIANKTEAPKTEAPKTEAPNKETSSEDTELDADWSSSEPEVSPSVFPAKGQVHPPSTIRSRSRSLSVGHKAAVAAPPAVGFRTPSPRTTTPAPPLTVDTKHRLTGRKVPPTGIAKTPLPSPMAVPPELRPDSHPAKITTPSGNTQPTSLPVAPPVAPPIVIATPIVGPPPEAVSRVCSNIYLKTVTEGLWVH